MAATKDAWLTTKTPVDGARALYWALGRRRRRSAPLTLCRFSFSYRLQLLPLPDTIRARAEIDARWPLAGRNRGQGLAAEGPTMTPLG